MNCHKKLLGHLLPTLFVAILIGLGPSDVNGQGASPRVSWSADYVAKTIGNGTAATATEVTFTVSARVTDAHMTVVPELARYVSVEPSTFSRLEPGVQYSIRLNYRLPPNAAEGVLEGTIHLRTGLRTIPTPLKISITVEYGDTIISPDAVSLSPDALALITGSFPNNLGLTFTGFHDELSQIAAGKILVLPPADNLPNGFLGRVTSIATSGDQLLVMTAPASLSEVFQKASVSYNQVFSRDDLSMTPLAPGVRINGAAATDGVISARFEDLVVFESDGHQILIDGFIDVSPEVDFRFDFDDWNLNSMAFTVDFNESSEFRVTADVAAIDFEYERELIDVDFGRIVIWVGWLPVVIDAEASLVVKAGGRASVGVSVFFTHSSSGTVGAGYANGGFFLIRHFTSASHSDDLEFTAGADLKGQLGPRVTLLLYGLAGPRVDVTGFGELDINPFRNPIWQLWGGLEASVGLHLEVLDHEIADIEFPGVIQYRVLITEGGTPSNARIIGQVRDAISQTTLPGSTVGVFRDGSLVDTVLTNSEGRFEVNAVPGAVYRFLITRSGYVSVTYENVVVQPNEVRTLDVILQVDDEHAGLGTASGRVVNALSGAGVAGVTLNLRRGLNSTTGTIVRTTTTGTGGTYSFANLPAGNYTAEASASGFLTAYFPVLSIGNTTTANQNGVISPVLPENQLRVILTWGATPADLDSHFFGPLAGGGRFHMYYARAGNNSPWPTIVNLDLDDVTSFGPETTTLYQQIDGVYRFLVHDYTNRSSTTSAALSASSAQVRVYRGANLINSFNVPLGQPGTVWTVFEMSGNTVVPINTMSFSSAPAGGLALGDSLENLPTKR